MLYPQHTTHYVSGSLGAVIDFENLTGRLATILANEDILTLAELAMHTDASLLKLKNFGRLTLKEVKTLLAEHQSAPGALPEVPELLRKLKTTGIPEAIVYKMLAAMARKVPVSVMSLFEPRLLAVVLWNKAAFDLTEDEEFVVNAKLAPYGLRLGMSIHDLFAQQSDVPRELTEWHYQLLGSDISALDLPEDVAKEFGTCKVVVAMLIANLPNYRFRAVFEEQLNVHGLSLRDTFLAEQALLALNR